VDVVGVEIAVATTSSTSTRVTLAAVAIIGLKFRAVSR